MGNLQLLALTIKYTWCSVVCSCYSNPIHRKRSALKEAKNCTKCEQQQNERYKEITERRVQRLSQKYLKTIEKHEERAKERNKTISSLRREITKLKIEQQRYQELECRSLGLELEEVTKDSDEKQNVKLDKQQRHYTDNNGDEEFDSDYVAAVSSPLSSTSSYQSKRKKLANHNGENEISSDKPNEESGRKRQRTASHEGNRLKKIAKSDDGNESGGLEINNDRPVFEELSSSYASNISNNTNHIERLNSEKDIRTRETKFSDEEISSWCSRDHNIGDRADDECGSHSVLHDSITPGTSYTDENLLFHGNKCKDDEIERLQRIHIHSDLLLLSPSETARREADYDGSTESASDG